VLRWQTALDRRGTKIRCEFADVPRAYRFSGDELLRVADNRDRLHIAVLIPVCVR
jgi:hypothetical protein